MRLDAAAWGSQKLLRKGGKQIAWLSVGLFTGFTFVGYFTPIHTLAAQAALLSFSPWEWFWVLFYGLATYGAADRFRHADAEGSVELCGLSVKPWASIQGGRR